MASPIDLLESLMSEEDLAEDLRDWFGKGKKGGVGGGGWDRYNTKGERIGKCAAPERGATEGKPKCLSKEKAAQLRAKGGKKAIANAVKRKKAQDPVTDRPGTGNVPKYVSSRIKEASDEEAHVFTPEFEEVLLEKNVPTNPSLWSRAKAEAKKRFDVYPCVPLDSLAITKSGPTSHEDIEIGDEILTYNMATDNLEWKPVLHKHYYENAPLIEIGKPTGFSVKCTPNHKWVISTKTERKLIEAKDIKTHMDILMCASLQNESSLLLSEWSKSDKWIDHIFSMNINQREIFLASSIVYDGWDKGLSSKFNKRHTFGFTQKKYDHLWASLLAAYLNGYYVSYREKSNQITGATYIRNKRTHATQNLYKKDAGEAPVWCPSTDNETWVMIQNGLITITGNSAYANGWAAKWYKERGGGWRTEKNESNTPSNREWGTKSLVDIYKKDTPGEELDEFFGMNFIEVGPELVQSFKKTTPGQTPMHKSKESLVDIILEAAHVQSQKTILTEKIGNVVRKDVARTNNPYLSTLINLGFEYDSSDDPSKYSPPVSGGSLIHFFTNKADSNYIVSLTQLGTPRTNWNIVKWNRSTGKYDLIVASGRRLGAEPAELQKSLTQTIPSLKRKKIDALEKAKKGAYHELLSKEGFTYKETIPGRDDIDDKHIYEAEAGPSQKNRIKAFRVDVTDTAWEFYEVSLGGNIPTNPLKKGNDKSSLERLIREIKRKNWIKSAFQSAVAGAAERNPFIAIGSSLLGIGKPKSTVSTN